MPGQILGAVLGKGLDAAIQFGLAHYNNENQRLLMQEDRYENYRYSEAAANNADIRTRNLYNDFYSPAALLKQYQGAGLSPSLMFGGTPGQGGTSGAQGSGAQGPTTPYHPVMMPGDMIQSALQAAQIAAVKAQTEKTKAETENVKEDTWKKELENQLQTMTNEKYRTEFTLLNSRWKNDQGNETSLFELADKCYSYESFLNAVRSAGDTDQILKELSTTEYGQKTLRNIYEGTSRFHRDITVLSEETVSSSFQLSITKALEKYNFVDLNAQTAVSQLQQEIQTNELTESQKEAWNNLIDRLGQKGSTGRDIAIVLGMILSNFASHTGIKVNVGK